MYINISELKHADNIIYRNSTQKVVATQLQKIIALTRKEDEIPTAESFPSSEHKSIVQSKRAQISIPPEL